MEINKAKEEITKYTAIEDFIAMRAELEGFKTQGKVSYVDFFWPGGKESLFQDYIYQTNKLEEAINILNLPNHQTCFHVNFRSYYTCVHTDKYELLLVIAKAIELVEKDSKESV